MRSSLLRAELAALTTALEASPGDLLLLVADDAGVAAQTLGALRVELARRFGLTAEGDWKPVWITDFPLVEWNDDEGRWDPLHHPFTSPTEDSLELLGTDPAAARARGYDIVINGQEIGGGSIRINRPEVQYRVLEARRDRPGGGGREVRLPDRGPARAAPRRTAESRSGSTAWSRSSPGANRSVT